MKTLELEGVPLDAAVAKACGVTVQEVGGKLISGAKNGRTPDDYPVIEWAPSMLWEQGGPIIEQERIGIAYRPLYGWVAGRVEAIDALEGSEINFDAVGPTPLIAAMRAYVAAKFGEEMPDR